MMEYLNFQMVETLSTEKLFKIIINPTNSYGLYLTFINKQPYATQQILGVRASILYCNENYSNVRTLIGNTQNVL